MKMKEIPFLCFKILIFLLPSYVATSSFYYFFSFYFLSPPYTPFCIIKMECNSGKTLKKEPALAKKFKKKHAFNSSNKFQNLFHTFSNNLFAVCNIFCSNFSSPSKGCFYFCCLKIEFFDSVVHHSVYV